MVSINTNIAAYYAQANIDAASSASTSNVARLSSGNAIVNASDNVAALAIGTSLASQVSALQTAGTNATQGGSLLQVADGALAQIQSILQQQQSIASQAQSGALTNTDRGFLNEQFQTLTNEINALATGTTFNGVNLIDGSIAAAGTVGSNNPLVNASVDTSTPSDFAADKAGFYTQTAGSATGLGAFTYSGFTVNTTAGASEGDLSAVTIVGPSGANDATLNTAGLQAGVVTASVIGGAGTIVADGSGAATAYAITYTIGTTTYTGTLAMAPDGAVGDTADTTPGTDGSVAAGTSVVLTDAADPSNHATITLTVGAGGITNASAYGDASTEIGTNFTAALKGSGSSAATTGAISGVGVLAPATTTSYDTALQGDLSQGTFSVVANGSIGTSGTATGYTVSYNINGITYQGELDNSSEGEGTASAATLTLLATTDQDDHSSIAITVSADFGVDGQYVDQSNNIKQALQSEFQNATLLSGTSSTTISGTTSTSGITAINSTNDIGKNDTALVGDLSTGTFNVTGSNAAGFNVSYTINGSTYQGSLSAANSTAGGTLVLDNGNGSIAFSIAATAAATAGTASTLQAALQTFLTSTSDSVTTGATALASHSVATTLSKDSSGNTIQGSAITAAAATATGFLDGFSGSDVTLTSGSFTGGAANLPPIANFSATGTGATTVLSVTINGVNYSTGLAVPANGSDLLNATTFQNGALTSDQGTAGVVTFFKNGDTSSSDTLALNLLPVPNSTLIQSTGDVTNVVNALNTVFGSGGSTGGLTFELGTTASADVTVNIGSAQTSALFGATALNISTQTGATAATSAVSDALNTLTSLRASVGAFESQFNFASAAIQSSQQNEAAASGDLLDTNIATESTAYATNQVKLQAGISVLAQANQQTQALLKLIG